MDMVALPFGNLEKKVCKPLGKKYLQIPSTIGEKIRNRRLELRLWQKEVAAQLGICEETLHRWETNKGEPFFCHYPKIIQFLGYFPVSVDTSTFGGKVIKYRYLKGLTQAEFAREFTIDESMVSRYENNKNAPKKGTIKKFERLFIEIEQLTIFPKPA
jgi:transcriptional regulator with XRE-family HTH domain